MKLTNYFEQKKKEKLRQERQRKAKAAAAGVLTGSIVGAVGGLLFAPKSGKETRKDIADYSNNVTTEISDKLSDGKEKLTEATSKLKEFIAEKKAARVNQEVEEVVEEIAATKEQ
ncbi:MAG: YtxH domain-containing protein [Bacillaceae bacterium]